jgi:hypothetical protein
VVELDVEEQVELTDVEEQVGAQMVVVHQVWVLLELLILVEVEEEEHQVDLMLEDQAL